MNKFDSAHGGTWEKHMSLSDQISELRGLEHVECFHGPKVLPRLAKILSELEICDGWLYHSGCGRPGGNRRAGTAILQGLLQDALHERGSEWEMKPIFTGKPGTSAETRCQEALDRVDILHSAEALLAAHIQALKEAHEEQSRTESSTNNTRR
ncbi:MAG TPA: hypothetical protein VN455_12050 [Methanotrichaceae archaeon]|nr:hypothetical protein [Methanotrichaceae archaeon]